jgi:hypothetical protein
MNNLSLVSALAFEPRKAFDDIAQRPRFWFALLTLLVCTLTISIWYQTIVDMGWLVDKQMRAIDTARRLTEEQIAQRVRMAAEHPGAQLAITVVATAIFLPVVMLIVGLYYSLAGKVTNVERSFKQWFSLACWTSLPTVLTVIPAAVVLLTATTRQIEPADMQPLSLNSLIFHRAMGEPGYSLFTSMQLTQFLSLYLAALGVKLWSGKSWLFGIVFAALPFVLFYGIWAYIALGRS